MEPTANKFWDSLFGQLLQHNQVVDVIKRFCEIYKQDCLARAIVKAPKPCYTTPLFTDSK